MLRHTRRSRTCTSCCPRSTRPSWCLMRVRQSAGHPLLYPTLPCSAPVPRYVGPCPLGAWPSLPALPRLPLPVRTLSKAIREAISDSPLPLYAPLPWSLMPWSFSPSCCPAAAPCVGTSTKQSTNHINEQGKEQDTHLCYRRKGRPMSCLSCRPLWAARCGRPPHPRPP